MSDSSDKEECCGNGCLNCVLDKRQKHVNNSIYIENKTNILSDKYCNFHLISAKEHINNNVWEFTFKYSNETNLNLNDYTIHIPLGFYLMLRAPNQDASYSEEFISRPYTPIDVDNDNFTFKILVKFVDKGRMSNHLKKYHINMITEWKGPYGLHSWEPNKFSQLICFSQGVGIAPIYRIIKSILENEEDDTVIDWRLCFKNVDNIIKRNEIYEYKQFWNFNYQIYLSELHQNTKFKYQENINERRLNEIDIIQLLSQNSNKLNEICILICGSNIFSNFIINIVKNCKFGQNNIIVF